MKKLTQKFLFGLAAKIVIVSLMAICLVMFNSNVKAQTLLVNYDFASAVAGTPCKATPLTTAQNVTSIFTTGGTNGETCTTTRGQSTPWVDPPVGLAFGINPEGNLAVSVSSSTLNTVNYFQFQLNGVSAYRSYVIYFQTERSGPIDIQYSLDGDNFTTCAQIPKVQGQGELTWRFPPRTFDLSSVTALNGQPTVYFRLVGKSFLNSSLRFDLDNFQVQATAATDKRKRVRIAF
jgi:hypothetical protein